MTSIREVARIAGVSPATVSRVMNGTAKVNEEKRKRVEAPLKRLDFVQMNWQERYISNHRR